MYFELLQPWTRRMVQGEFPAGIYYHPGMLGSSIVASQSSRIWEEKEGRVWYVKDRVAWNREPDPKEFAWIKLRAKRLEDYR